MLEAESSRPFMSRLDAEDRARLLAAATRRSFAAGEELIRAADPPGDMFVLLGGRAPVEAVSEDGRVISYRDVAPGDVVGELSPLDDQPRCAGVRAAGPVRAAIADRPGLACAVNRHLAGQIRALTMRVMELGTLIVRARLTRELDRRAERSGREGDGAVGRPAPTLAELAARIGAHRELVTTELGRLSREGLVRRHKDGIVIPSLTDLLA